MQTAEPLVTIGISSRNRCELLRKAISATLAQTWPSKEILVVDDASTDRTPTLAAEFPGVRWIRQKRSVGYLSARNDMMQESVGKYFCGLDDDAWFFSDKALEVAVRAMEQEPRWGAAGFDILDPGRPDPVRRGEPFPVDTFIGCGHLLRLAAVHDLGGYVPLPGAYGCEEKDLCLRLLDRGWEVVLLPGVHVWHEKTAVARDAAAQHASGVCNVLAFACLRYPASALAWRLPAKVLSHLRFAMRMGLLRPCSRGMVEFASSLPRIVRQRRPVSVRALRESHHPARRIPPRV